MSKFPKIGITTATFLAAVLSAGALLTSSEPESSVQFGRIAMPQLSLSK